MIIKNIDLSNIQSNVNIIFVIGNSASGKSTLADNIGKKLKYDVVHMDEMIRNLSKNHVNGMKITKLYKEKQYMVEKKIIIQQIKDIIKKSGYLIVEGTIWDPYIIKQISKNYSFQLIYVQPSTKRKYFNRIMKRVKEGTMSIVKKSLTNEELKNEKKVKELVHKIVNMRFEQFEEDYKIFHEFTLCVLKY